MLSFEDIKYWELCHPSNELGKCSPNSYPAKCPVCGGSHSNPNEKKLYLYSKNGITSVKCFHAKCEYSASLKRYIREHHSELYNQYVQDTQGLMFKKLVEHNSASNNTESVENGGVGESVIDTGFDMSVEDTIHSNTVNLDIPAEQLTLYDLTQYTEDIFNVPSAMAYLSSRGVIPKPEWNWRIGTVPLDLEGKTYKIEGFIVIPLMNKEGLWYGFYSRSIKYKKFLTFIPDNNIGTKVWNWYNIDLSKPVYIFEAIFDAISSGKENCIATLGSSLPDSKSKLIKHKVWCFDFDTAGINAAIRNMSGDDKVLILPSKYKGIKDLNTFVTTGVLTIPQISDMIDKNTHEGLVGLAKLKIGLV